MTDAYVKTYVGLVQPDSTRGETGGAFVLVSSTRGETLQKLAEWLQDTYHEIPGPQESDVFQAFDEHGYDVTIEEHVVHLIFQVEFVHGDVTQSM